MIHISISLNAYPVPTSGKKMPDSSINRLFLSISPSLNDFSDSILAIAALFWAFQETDGGPLQTGIIATVSASFYASKEIEYVWADDEFALVNKFITLVVELDPDVITGWEVQRSSWGYLERRGDLLSMFHDFMSLPFSLIGLLQSLISLSRSDAFLVARRNGGVRGNTLSVIRALSRLQVAMS